MREFIYVRNEREKNENDDSNQGGKSNVDIMIFSSETGFTVSTCFPTGKTKGAKSTQIVCVSLGFLFVYFSCVVLGELVENLNGEAALSTSVVRKT